MNDLTVGKEGKVILRFALPMLLGNVFQQLYNIVDSMIVGNFLGKEALSAVGASFPIIFVLISLIIGVATGFTIVIAQFFGAKNFTKVKLAIDTMYIVLFFSSFLIAGIGLFFSEAILKLIDLPAEIIPQAKLYLNITLAGSIVMFGYNGTAAILRGLGDSKTPLYFLIISTLVNIVLDYVFVAYFGWGIAGVAIATVIAQGGSFLTAVYYLNHYHQIINISAFHVKLDIGILKKSLRIGLPSGLQQMFVAMGMLAVFKIVNAFGTNVIAAYSVALRIDSFALMPAFNFSSAFSTFVGQNVGANKPKRIIKGLWATLRMTSLISVSFSAIALLFGKNIMAWFTSDYNVIMLGAEYLTIIGIFYILFSAMFSINAVFRGSGDTIVPMFITLFALWFVRLPVSYYLSLEIGKTGIWWGVPIAWAVGLSLSFFYYLSGKWKIPINTL